MVKQSFEMVYSLWCGDRNCCVSITYVYNSTNDRSYSTLKFFSAILKHTYYTVYIMASKA